MSDLLGAMHLLMCQYKYYYVALLYYSKKDRRLASWLTKWQCVRLGRSFSNDIGTTGCGSRRFSLCAPRTSEEK